MKNLLFKSLLVLSIVTTTQTIMGINASAYYTRYTREFLGYLGVKNPSSVPVNKVAPNDRFYKGAAGYANGKAIYINEDLLANPGFPEAVRLFTCAHEATHHALGHPFQVKRNILEIEQEADVQAAHMLCKNGYRWIVEQEVAHLGRLVQAGRGQYTDGIHPTTQQQYNYLKAVLGANSGGKSTVAKQPVKAGSTAKQAAQKATIKRTPVNSGRKANSMGNRFNRGFAKQQTWSFMQRRQAGVRYR